MCPRLPRSWRGPLLPRGGSFWSFAGCLTCQELAPSRQAFFWAIHYASETCLLTPDLPGCGYPDRRRTGRRHPRLREAADASSTCPRITARGKGIRAEDSKVNDPPPWLRFVEDEGVRLVGEGRAGAILVMDILSSLGSTLLPLAADAARAAKRMAQKEAWGLPWRNGYLCQEMSRWSHLMDSARSAGSRRTQKEPGHRRLLRARGYCGCVRQVQDYSTQLPVAPRVAAG